jgi:uncharacterized membrane protein (DUF4010 family)
MNVDQLLQMAYALGIGVLVGLERSMGAGAPAASRADAASTAGAETATAAGADAAAKASAAPEAVSTHEPLDDVMGVRTFTVLSLVGYVAALAGDRVPVLPPVALAGVSALVVAMYLRARELGLGITTEAAAIATFLLGFLAHTDAHAAGVLAILLTVVLASKRFTRETVRKMRRVELTDTLKLLVVVLIVLPLLPNRTLDPWGALNPRKVGMLVLLISGIGYVGYFLTRILGARRGLGLTGILGGLTSSTAVTAAMAAEAKQRPEHSAICTFSTIAANATMFARVLAVVVVLDRALALRLAWPIGAMCLVATVAAVVLWLRAGRGERPAERSEIPLKNPFSVGPALKFAVFFVAILLVAKLAKTYLGEQGLYAAAALSGLADVDAITLTIAEQTKSAALAQGPGAIGITIAIVSNSVVKTGISFYAGGLAFGRLVALCLGLATGAGLVVVFLA